jgi:hypothetical protein
MDIVNNVVDFTYHSCDISFGAAKENIYSVLRHSGLINHVANRLLSQPGTRSDEFHFTIILVGDFEDDLLMFKLAC